MSDKQVSSDIAQARARMRRARIMFGVFGALLVAAFAFGAAFNRTEPAPQLSPEELRQQMERVAAEKAKREARELELGHVINGGRALRDASHNPKRFEMMNAVSVGNRTGCYEYRAENGFGALRIGQAVLYKGKLIISHEDGFQRVWNARCANKTGTDVTASIR